MRCSYCDFQGARPELHAHLTDGHGDRVETWETRTGRRFYELKCPHCDDSYRREVKPRLRDPGFLEEYAREIRVVAFDMFLYHLQGEHEREANSV
jgi:DNA-directed RNA polymerase subunit RPC12/RpoP